MSRMLPGVSVLVLVAVSPAFADIPLPKNLKYVTPRVRFDGLVRHPSHAFYLKYYSGSGNPFASPPWDHELKNGEVFEMSGGRRIAGMQVFALPREEAAQLEKKDPSRAWLNEKTPGILVADVIPPSTTAPASAREVPVTAYRVTMQDKQLNVKMVGQRRGEVAPVNPWRTVVAGAFLAFSLALFGLWLVRRRGSGVV